jgi:hypothetical protein
MGIFSSQKSKAYCISINYKSSLVAFVANNEKEKKYRMEQEKKGHLL